MFFGMREEIPANAGPDTQRNAYRTFKKRNAKGASESPEASNEQQPANILLIVFGVFLSESHEILR